jgi:hypothetical protein
LDRPRDAGGAKRRCETGLSRHSCSSTCKRHFAPVCRHLYSANSIHLARPYCDAAKHQQQWKSELIRYPELPVAGYINITHVASSFRGATYSTPIVFYFRIGQINVEVEGWLDQEWHVGCSGCALINQEGKVIPRETAATIYLFRSWAARSSSPWRSAVQPPRRIASQPTLCARTAIRSIESIPKPALPAPAGCPSVRDTPPT